MDSSHFPLHSSLKFFLSLALLILSVTAMADNGRLYGSERLSSSLTSTICQDRYGYIWIGTEYGLNKFDGYRFTPYFSSGNDSTTLYNNEITALFVDRKGRLWVGQSKGLARYDYLTNSFVRYTVNGRMPRVSAMLEHDGSLLIGTSGYGIFTLKDGATVAERLPMATRRRTDDFCSSLFVDANGDIWRSSHLHLVTRYRRGKDGVYTQKDYPLMPKGPAVEFLSDGSKGFWIICMYGIMRYDYARHTLSDAGVDLSVIGNTVTMRTATLDAKGNMLIGTSGGGLVVLPRGGKTLINAAGNSKDILLHNTNVNNILCDRQGGVWLSCYGKGVYRAGGGDKAFSSHTFSDNNITLGSRITSTAYCYGAIWCTVQYSGLYRFDADGNNLRVMDSPQGTNLVYSDRSGQMWICTNNALYRYSAGGTYEKAAQMNGFGLNAMTDDGKGKLYISDFGRGLVVYDTKTGRTTGYSMNDKPKRTNDNVLHNDWIKSLCMVAPDILVVGTVEGLQAMNTATGAFGPVQFSGMECSALLKADGSQLLVGTLSGLYTYGLHTAVEQPMKGAEMLRDKKICAIRKDRHGNVWVSTSAGIWKKAAGDSQWQGYIHGNGLAAKEYVMGASFALPGGEIGFATADGITFFLPEAVERLEQHTADARLSTVIVGGEMLSPLHDTYVIPYGNNSLSLEFSTMNYSDVDNVTYEYRIGGGRWKPFIEGNNITFTHMPPGTYRIEVRARNGSNVSEHVKAITVRVEHPWYASPIACTLYIIIGVVTLAMVLLYYRRRKRRELDEAKMQFLINATHDIRSPLTLILGPLAKLRGITSDERQMGYLNIIERNAQRLLVLVNQILDERKIDKNQMRLHCKRCDISQFVGNVCSLYQYRADEKSIRLTFTASASPARAWIDSIQFDKVINNLLSNAFKYTPDGGEIAVGVADNGKEVTVTVTDSGVGLDGENREKLFERFYQGKNSIKNQTPGTGIGLNLSRTIVEMHGGRITAANRCDGAPGAQFTVALRHGFQHLKPEYIDEDQVDDAPAANDRSTQTTQNTSVLVVDDNSDLTQYISNELGGTYRITTCADGMEALSALHRAPFDIVVTDVMMPRMDGIELLRNIKQTPRLNHIPVVMLTSKTEIEDRLLGLRRGADAYMAKPFNIEELQAQIAAIIDNVRRLRGKYSGQLHTDDGAIQAPEVTGNDDSLMERVIKVINDNLGNPDFNVEMLASEVCVSRAHLHRKMKEITGISTSEYIRNIRIEHASRLIRDRKINITQVAYAVGFNNQAHFSTVFKKHFGMTPSEYAARGEKD